MVAYNFYEKYYRMKEKSNADLTKQSDEQRFKAHKNIGGETKEGNGVREQCIRPSTTNQN